MDPHFYSTIEKSAIAEFKDRGSKFLAYSYPVESVDACKKIIAGLKKEHPKAVHFCVAYRIGVEGNIFRASDDGEPAGSAGRPILGQIDSKELTNLMVVVVRYFGGTKLGVGGLINAYKTTAKLILDEAIIVQKTIDLYYQLIFEYQDMNKVMRIIKEKKLQITSQKMEMECEIEIAIRKKNVQNLMDTFESLYEIKLTAI